MKKFLRNIDIIILIFIAIAAGVLAVMHFLGLVDSMAEHSPVLTLLLLSFVGLHLIISHFSQEDFQKETNKFHQQIIDGLRDTKTTVFNDSIEMEAYLGKRMLEATKSICDLTWKSKISSGFSASTRKVAHGNLENCIKEASSRIDYREIFIFNDKRRVEKFERRLAENNSGYSCRYFKDDERIPRLQFVIIDNEEVFFFASSSDSNLCSIRSHEISKVFKSYYDAAWHSAIPLKDGHTVHSVEVEKVRKIFKPK
ncbi:MAG: hypothetical protein HYS23_10460 [Geobacter sp.]|nr:hypothetical protein [Geobacter sp.]